MAFAAFGQEAAADSDPVLRSAQRIRATGCGGHAGIRAELQSDGALDDVARRWGPPGSGKPVATVFETAGVRVRASASLAVLRGKPEDLLSLLADRLCTELTSAEWTRLGWYANADGVWVVMAIPSKPPAREAAAAVATTALRLTNALRARGARCGNRTYGPAPPVALDSLLTRAAQAQADEMARFMFLAHEGRDGSTPAERVNRTGYAWRVVGENVAAGPESAEEVMQGWEESPEHCKNIMDPDFTVMGIAFAVNPKSTGHSTWWSMVLARPKR